jgi:hypothetical protein
LTACRARPDGEVGAKSGKSQDGEKSMTDERIDQFFERLRVVLLDVSRIQTDELFARMKNLSETQTRALTKAINVATQAQTTAIAPAIASLSVHFIALERMIEELRDGRGSLQ